MSRAACIAAATCLVWAGPVSNAQAQIGTAFTYQGYLEQGGEPVTGDIQCEFSICDVESGGTPLGTQVEILVRVGGDDAVSVRYQATLRWQRIVQHVRPGHAAGKGVEVGQIDVAIHVEVAQCVSHDPSGAGDVAPGGHPRIKRVPTLIWPPSGV